MRVRRKRSAHDATALLGLPAAKPYIDRARTPQPDIWEDFVYLVEQRQRVQRARKRPALFPSATEITEFLSDEESSVPIKFGLRMVSEALDFGRQNRVNSRYSTMEGWPSG